MIEQDFKYQESTLALVDELTDKFRKELLRQARQSAVEHESLIVETKTVATYLVKREHVEGLKPVVLHGESGMQAEFVAYLKGRCLRDLQKKLGSQLDTSSITYKETIMIKDDEIRGIDVIANARSWDGKKARCNFMIQIRYADLMKSKNIRRDA